MNRGEIEGTSYRGRLLVQLSVEPCDNVSIVGNQHGKMRKTNTVQPRRSTLPTVELGPARTPIAELHVTVGNAVELKDVEGLVGKNDPYVKLTIGDLERKTDVKSNAGRAATWN